MVVFSVPIVRPFTKENNMGKEKMNTDERKCAFCGRVKKEVLLFIVGPSVLICDKCVELSAQIISNEKRTLTLSGMIKEKTIITPDEISRQLDEWIIGQEQAKRTLSVAVYNHYKRLVNRSCGGHGVTISKSNILLVGPSGCGKTHLARALALILKVPLAIADATPLTQAGYVGEDVESILANLIRASGNDPALAAKGIIYLDEVDKLARRATSIHRDVGGEGVQQALLKILEGHIVSVRVGGDRSGNGGRTYELDTSNILFIAGGAFDGLAEMMASKDKPKSGFNANGLKIDGKIRKPRGIQSSDLRQYGFLPEFIGRLPIVVTLDGLDERQLAEIIVKPNDALLKQFKELFDMDGSQLEVTDDGLAAIARLAIERGTGARALRAVIEELLLDAMFELPSRKGSVYTLDEEAVSSGKARRSNTNTPMVSFA